MKIGPTQFFALLLILLITSIGSLAHARCGYYVGYGYRCFGDAGGTGGKVFKEMDENTKKCGYWDPGCQNQKAQPQNYQPPQSDGDYAPPTVGPGYQEPGSR